MALGKGVYGKALDLLPDFLSYRQGVFALGTAIEVPSFERYKLGLRT